MVASGLLADIEASPIAPVLVESCPTRIFLANVERLKQDYQNLNLDWNTSAFANMDQQVRLTVASGGSGGGTMPGTGTGGTTPGTGGGTGGGGAAPGTTPTTNTGGTGTGTNAAQNLALSKDPALAYRYMMQQLGFDPSAPGLLGKFLKQQFQPLLEARMAAAGVGDNAHYMDTLDSTIRDFGGGLFQKGGNFYGNLADEELGRVVVEQDRARARVLKDPGVDPSGRARAAEAEDRAGAHGELGGAEERVAGGWLVHHQAHAAAELGEELGFQVFWHPRDAARASQQDREFGDLLKISQERSAFGRIAAQTAKQVIAQRVR